jgi:hypothetical protein
VASCRKPVTSRDVLTMRPVRPQPTQVAGIRGSKLEYPPADRFIGDVATAFGQQFLDIAVIQDKPQIEPDGMPDDLGWELMTGMGDRCMPPTLHAAQQRSQHSRDKAP